MSGTECMVLRYDSSAFFELKFSVLSCFVIEMDSVSAVARGVSASLTPIIPTTTTLHLEVRQW